MEAIAGELLKLATSGVLGFVLGRLQAKHADSGARFKTQQEKLLEVVRSCGKDAIEYHCLTLDEKGKVLRCDHLRNDLFRIRSDLMSLADQCRTSRKVWVPPCAEMLDAITDFPFVPEELPTMRDAARTARISVATEAVATVVRTLQRPIFQMPEWARFSQRTRR